MQQNYILGGYFLVIPATRADYMDQVLLPETIISVSECICGVLPSMGIFRTSDKVQFVDRIKKTIRLDDNEFSNLEKWLTKKFNNKLFDWPSCFADIDTAKEFQKRFLQKVNEVYLIAIGLTENEAEIFIEEQRALGGVGNIRETVMVNLFQKKIDIDINNIIGFDILGLDTDYFHSYLCHGLEKGFYKELGIKPNNLGLYACYQDASKAMKYIETNELELEEALWQSWVVSLVDKFRSSV
jgi:hypothetical protein